jgi:hypothetical protein
MRSLRFGDHSGLEVNARLVELAEAIGETQFWTGGRYKSTCGDRSDDCFEWVGNPNIPFCDNLPNRDNDGKCAQCRSRCLLLFPRIYRLFLNMHSETRMSLSFLVKISFRDFCVNELPYKL